MKTELGPKNRLAVRIAVLAVGANFMFNAPSLSAQTTGEEKKPSKDLMTLAHERDSLIEANADLFNRAQDEYYESLDKKYTMRLFFSRRELKKLNKALDPYFQKFADSTKLSGDIGVEYKYIKLIFPMKADMPFGEFYYILRKLKVPADVLAPFGIISHNGRIDGFKNVHKQNNFECYGAAFENGRMVEGQLPDGPKFDEIYEQWETTERLIEQKRQQMMSAEY